MEDDRANDTPETSVNLTDRASTPVKRAKKGDTIAGVERITALVLMTSGILFALVAIAAIWGAFGDNGEVVWRSLGSLAVIALAAAVINIAARMIEGRR
jgi:hypothetical protein